MRPFTFLALCSMLLAGLKPASAALIFDISDITTTSITFRLSGAPSGDPTANFEDYRHVLFIEAPNVEWISQAITLSIDASPITTRTVGLTRTLESSPYGDRIEIYFSGDLDSFTVGTGEFVTLTSPSAVFDPLQVDNLALYWGFNDESSQPFGAFQSSATVVPEPSTAALLLIGISAVLLRRRKSE